MAIQDMQLVTLRLESERGDYWSVMSARTRHEKAKVRTHDPVESEELAKMFAGAPDAGRALLRMKERLELQGCSAPGYSADYEMVVDALRKMGVLP